MPDPIDELEGFTMPSVTPAPASEVRRRGDRIRRRNRALAAAGTLAAIAVIATPVAVLANHTTSSQRPIPPSDQPPGGWTTTIPAGFDVTALPDGAKFEFTVNENGSVADDVTVCGVPSFSSRSNDPGPAAVDATGASWGEGNSEGSEGRTVAVYPNADAAARAADTLRQAVEGCPEDTSAGSKGPAPRWSVVDGSVPGADESFYFTRAVPYDASVGETYVFEVARVGNALYLGSSYQNALGDVSRTVHLLTQDSDPVVAEMCVFSTDPC